MAKAETFGAIIDQAESYGEDDWKEFAKEIQFSTEDEFYLFEQDAETKMSDFDRMSEDYLVSLLHPTATKNVSPSYRVNRTVHDVAFTRDKGLFGTMQKLYGKLEGDGKAKQATNKVMHGLEHGSKQIMFGCKDCGDCSLPECAYLCPRASCSKTGRNGPCGGSHNGRCELDDKECIWARAYDRTKYYGESQQMFDAPPVLYNPNLDGTSAWANTYLDRDHNAPREEGTTPLLPDPKPAKKRKH